MVKEIRILKRERYTVFSGAMLRAAGEGAVLTKVLEERGFSQKLGEKKLSVLIVTMMMIKIIKFSWAWKHMGSLCNSGRTGVIRSNLLAPNSSCAVVLCTSLRLLSHY